MPLIVNQLFGDERTELDWASSPKLSFFFNDAVTSRVILGVFFDLVGFGYAEWRNENMFYL